ERKHMEDRLRVTQFAVDRASDAVFWVDSSGRLLYTNDAACRSLGYTREELLQKSVPDVDPAYGPDVWPRHWQELQTQGSITFETVHQHKSGKRFPVEVTVNYLPLNEKEYLFAFVRNIAPRKAAEDALKKANAE